MNTSVDDQLKTLPEMTREDGFEDGFLACLRRNLATIVLEREIKEGVVVPFVKH